MTGGFITHSLAIALGCLLLAAAFTDLRGRVIEHWTVIAIAALAPLMWWANGYSLWPDVALQLLLALVVFAVFTGFWMLGQMGGGDVKLLAALALWLPIGPLFTMLMVMAIAGGVITVALLARHKLSKSDRKIEVPYGVAISLGGLWVLSEPYLNQFA